MIKYLQNYELSNIRNKLICIYILNVTDIAFTLYLKSTGFFIEANPLIALLLKSTPAALAVKAALPAALVAFLYLRMRKASESQLKKSNYYLLAILLIYALINILHIVWICLFLFR